MASRKTRLRIPAAQIEQQINRWCVTGKVCFPTHDAAFESAEIRMSRGEVNPGCHIMPYPCDRCGKWHIANYKISFDRAATMDETPKPDLTKPVPGTFQRERDARQRNIAGKEKRLKRESKERDGWTCTLPDCTVAGPGNVHSAHVGHKGMGGDRNGTRTSLDLLLTMCADDHRAFDGNQHGGATVRVEFLTDRKANGPREFFRRYTDQHRQEKWRSVGISHPVSEVL